MYIRIIKFFLDIMRYALTITSFLLALMLVYWISSKAISIDIIAKNINTDIFEFYIKYYNKFVKT
jgi:hypothetical protein